MVGKCYFLHVIEEVLKSKKKEKINHLLVGKCYFLHVIEEVLKLKKKEKINHLLVGKCYFLLFSCDRGSTKIEEEREN